MKVLKKQTNTFDCLVCGIDNPIGLNAAFYEMEDNSVIGLFQFQEKHHSYPGRTHGGMIAAVLDEAMGRAIWVGHPEAWSLTLKLEIEYHKPVPYDVPLKCVARIDKEDAMTFRGVAEIQTLEGTMLAKGQGLYMFQPLRKISPKTNPDAVPDDVNVYVPDDVKEIN